MFSRAGNAMAYDKYGKNVEYLNKQAREVVSLKNGKKNCPWTVFAAGVDIFFSELRITGEPGEIRLYILLLSPALLAIYKYLKTMFHQM